MEGRLASMLLRHNQATRANFNAWGLAESPVCAFVDYTYWVGSLGPRQHGLSYKPF